MTCIETVKIYACIVGDAYFLFTTFPIASIIIVHAIDSYDRRKVTHRQTEGRRRLVPYPAVSYAFPIKINCHNRRG